ncbi:hypothetical protein FG475_07570 [Vibrio navarrensis]|nr:hypothetical protein [Vibrio navarrensis]
MITWNKLGQVHSPKGDKYWNQKYDILPVPEYIDDLDRIRIYIGTTDVENFGRITYIEVDANNPLNIVYEHNDFILDLGEDGTFDDCGVVPSCIIHRDGKSLLYTVGFQRCVKVPYMLFAGLAIGDKGNPDSFKRFSKAPILPRTPERPISQGAPWVLWDDGLFKMWHWFGTKWIDIEGKPFIDYHIGYAESIDGLQWDMKSEPCLWPIQEKGEFAVARPCVIKLRNIYHMWYSVRLEKVMYRIAYATSSDGRNWNRHEGDIGLNVSEHGWDSQMVCYPAVIKIKNRLLMFYNGNNNGETGFGVAESIIDE